MALAAVTHVGLADFGARHASRTLRHHRCSFPLHLGKQCIDNLAIQLAEQLVAAAHHFIGYGGEQKAHRRTHTCLVRDDDGLYAQLFTQARGMQRCGAAKSHHDTAADIEAEFGCVCTGGCSHVFFHHLSQASSGLLCALPQLFAQLIQQGLFGSPAIQPKRSAGKRRHMHPAQADICIGHGGACTTTAVSCRTRFGACALRANRNATQLVDGGNRTTARADLNHFDDRNTQR